jgi:hypothetical protein
MGPALVDANFTLLTVMIGATLINCRGWSGLAMRAHRLCQIEYWRDESLRQGRNRDILGEQGSVNERQTVGNYYFS